jgi:hypothetical protein
VKKVQGWKNKPAYRKEWKLSQVKMLKKRMEKLRKERLPRVISCPRIAWNQIN